MRANLSSKLPDRTLCLIRPFRRSGEELLQESALAVLETICANNLWRALSYVLAAFRRLGFTNADIRVAFLRINEIH